MAGEVGQRHTQANYLDVGGDTPTFELMGTGFAELNESPAAQTSSKRYVNDKAVTKRITGYDWTSSFNTDQIKSEAAIQFICDIGELQKTGAGAETDYVIVDLDQKVGSSGSSYHARKFHVAVEVSSFDNNDGEMAATGNLLQIGDLIEGSFDTSAKTFTVSSDPKP